MKFGIKARIVLLVLLAVAGCVAAAMLEMSSSWDSLLNERKSALVAQVDAAASVINGFVKAADKGEMSLKDAQERAKNAVRFIRYGNNEYMIVYDYKGISVVHGTQPEKEGTDRTHVKDTNNYEYVPDLIAKARQGGGFVQYYFPRPGSDVAMPKLTYSKNIDKWNWVVASGVYSDDLDNIFFNRLRHVLLTTLILGLILAVAGFLIARSIVKPLSQIVDNVASISNGNLSISVEGRSRTDEIGQMAKGVEALRNQALEKQRIEKDNLEVRTSSDRERQIREEERQQQVRTAETTMSVLGAALKRLSHGDLACEIVEPFDSSFEQLRKDFNEAIERLKDTMVAVASSVQTVHVNSASISASADDLSRRTEQQAASLEETAAALNEITAAVQRTVESAGHAREFVATAKQTAETSGVIVRNAVSAMDGIEKSSQQIGQIIGVIDEIAFQTNLLALNAGVEAARAGDAGRGFAVVAQEVRALAQRSADAAKEIKELISNSRSQVDHGVDLVARTGKALDQIVSQVTQINGIVNEIAASTIEQSTGLQEVSTAVNQMDVIIQQNAAMVEESTAASHNLAGEAAELTNLVGRFRTFHQVSGTAQSDSNATLNAKRNASASMNRPVVAMKSVGKGGAVPRTRTDAILTENSWNDF